MVVTWRVMRGGTEFQALINMIRAKYIAEGKSPPSIEKITNIIAKNVDKEKVLRDVIVKF